MWKNKIFLDWCFDLDKILLNIITKEPINFRDSFGSEAR